MSEPRRSGRLLRLLLLCAVLLSISGAVALADADGQPAPTAPSAADDPATNPEPARSPASTVAPTSSTSTSTTTTAPPAPRAAPTTVAPPAPAPAPAPAPTPAPAPSPSPLERVHEFYGRSVPASWRSAIAVRFEIIEGNTSWGHPSDLIQVGSYHATGSDANLAFTLAHEFGHLIAFHYGSGAYNGAAPEGWPAYSSNPAEAWADCVAQVFTGIVDPSHGLPPCSGSSLSWTASWLGQGPSAHPRTWR